jgi:hypothetical protein
VLLANIENGQLEIDILERHERHERAPAAE